MLPAAQAFSQALDDIAIARLIDQIFSLIRISRQVKQLPGDLAGEDRLNQLVTFIFDAALARPALRRPEDALIGRENRAAVSVGQTAQYGIEAVSFVGFGQGKTSPFAKCWKQVKQVDQGIRLSAGGNARPRA